MEISILIENEKLKDTPAIERKFTEKILIGRSKKCDLVIDDPLISSQHALLIIEGGKLKVKDLNSKNGTYLNNVKILDASFWIDDSIRIGNNYIKIDTHKLNEEAIKFLTYTGKHHRGVGELTLELQTYIRNFTTKQNSLLKLFTRKK